MAYLKILDQNSRQLELPSMESIPEGWELLIGRDGTCGLNINSAGISRIHAKVHHDGRHFLINDQDSTNGTLIIRTVNNIDDIILPQAFR